MEKNNYGKTGQSALAPWFYRKKTIMEIMATSKNYGKKKVRITSGIFWTLMGKNLIMEKSDAGAACLSWTFFFFHNSVGDHKQIPWPIKNFRYLLSALHLDDEADEKKLVARWKYFLLWKDHVRR